LTHKECLLGKKRALTIKNSHVSVERRGKLVSLSQEKAERETLLSYIGGVGKKASREEKKAGKPSFRTETYRRAEIN